MPRSAAPPVETGSDCVEATKQRLEDLKAAGSPEGQAALALAAAIDSGRALMAAPAMVKELRSTLDALAERAPRVEGSIDRVRAQREKRRAERSA